MVFLPTFCDFTWFTLRGYIHTHPVATPVHLPEELVSGVIVLDGSGVIRVDWLKSLEPKFKISYNRMKICLKSSVEYDRLSVQY